MKNSQLVLILSLIVVSVKAQNNNLLPFLKGSEQMLVETHKNTQEIDRNNTDHLVANNSLFGNIWNPSYTTNPSLTINRFLKDTLKTFTDYTRPSETKNNSILRLCTLRAEFSTFNTGGKLLTTPKEFDPLFTEFPIQQGFDYMDSYYVGFEAKPIDDVRLKVTFNILGNVALNPIDQIFYETRGRIQNVNTENGNVASTLDRLQLYQVEYNWNNTYFNLKGFYRVGHDHWGYEGDFFGLYKSGYYGIFADMYNGLAPRGLEIEGKKAFKGLKVAYGKELWWGANPALLVKYNFNLGKINVTGMFHEDVGVIQPEALVTSIAIPQPRTRRATLQINTRLFKDKLQVEAGAIWGGQPLVGRPFQIAEETEQGAYNVFTNTVKDTDTWGGKIKLTYRSDKVNWYSQAAIMGLVASGGGDYKQTFTGWKLKDSGSGNQTNFLTGFTYKTGKFEIAPNFIYQKPLLDPMPRDVVSPGRLRNILEDPFVVQSNREMAGSELLLTFDPTPKTQMYTWDSDKIEDAKFAASLGAVYRHLPTSQDASIVFTSAREFGPATGVPPALDLWEINARVVSNLSPDLKFIVNLYGGNGQAIGILDTRVIKRIGGDLRVVYKKIKLASFLKIDDWGPYDYHHNFNLTFPLQVMADLSTSIGKPNWLILPNTKLGVRFTWRSLDKYSPRYLPNTFLNNTGFDNGNEWELRTYLHINIGK